MRSKSRNKYARRLPGKKPRMHDPFTEIKAFVPKSLYNELAREAELRGVPINRLLVVAAMHALAGNGSFEVDISMPEILLRVENEEASTLFSWIAKSETGVSLDLLVMCRDDIGIPVREILMSALNHLMALGVVEMFNVDEQRLPKVRCVSNERVKRKERFKTFEGQVCDVDKHKPQVQATMLGLRKTKGVL